MTLSRVGFEIRCNVVDLQSHCASPCRVEGRRDPPGKDYFSDLDYHNLVRRTPPNYHDDLQHKAEYESRKVPTTRLERSRYRLFLRLRASRILALSRFSRRLRRRLISFRLSDAMCCPPAAAEMFGPSRGLPRNLTHATELIPV